MAGNLFLFSAPNRYASCRRLPPTLHDHILSTQLVPQSRIPIGTPMTCKAMSIVTRKRSPQHTFPVPFTNSVILIRAFLIRTIVPLCHILIMCSHLVTMSLLSRRITLVNLRLWSAALPSASTRTSLSALSAGLIFLQIVTVCSLLCGSTSCALTDCWGRGPWVFEVG